MYQEDQTTIFSELHQVQHAENGHHMLSSLESRKHSKTAILWHGRQNVAPPSENCPQRIDSMGLLAS